MRRKMLLSGLIGLGVGLSGAVAATVEWDLLATTGAVPTRTIVVGLPQGPMDATVIAIEDITDLSSEVELPETGGEIVVFVRCTVVGGDSAGLQGYSHDSVTSVPTGPEFSGYSFDVPYLDVAGRTTMIAGMSTPIPQERSIAGPLTTADAGRLFQAMTNFTTPQSGQGGMILTDPAAFQFALTSDESQVTLGIGQTANDQSTGGTIVARFNLTVPPLESGESMAEYTIGLNLSGTSTVLWIEEPVFQDPVTNGQSMLPTSVSMTDLVVRVVADETVPEAEPVPAPQPPIGLGEDTPPPDDNDNKNMNGNDNDNDNNNGNDNDNDNGNANGNSNGNANGNMNGNANGNNNGNGNGNANGNGNGNTNGNANGNDNGNSNGNGNGNSGGSGRGGGICGLGVVMSVFLNLVGLSLIRRRRRD